MPAFTYVFWQWDWVPYAFSASILLIEPFPQPPFAFFLLGKLLHFSIGWHDEMQTISRFSQILYENLGHSAWSWLKIPFHSAHLAIQFLYKSSQILPHKYCSISLELNSWVILYLQYKKGRMIWGITDKLKTLSPQVTCVHIHVYTYVWTCGSVCRQCYV